MNAIYALVLFICFPVPAERWEFLSAFTYRLENGKSACVFISSHAVKIHLCVSNKPSQHCEKEQFIFESIFLSAVAHVVFLKRYW